MLSVGVYPARVWDSRAFDFAFLKRPRAAHCKKHVSECESVLSTVAFVWFSTGRL
jgi:hypothetical protein